MNNTSRFAAVAIVVCSALICASAIPTEVFQTEQQNVAEATAPRNGDGIRTFGLSFPASVSARVTRYFTFIGPRRPARLGISAVLDLIRTAAAKHHVPAAFVRSIVSAESSFNSEVVSPKGAIGLMQLMPATAKEYGANAGLPDQNVDAGTHYLRVLMNRYRDVPDSQSLVIAAYNAGPGNVDKYNGIPPFPETQDYVVRVKALLQNDRARWHSRS